MDRGEAHVQQPLTNENYGPIHSSEERFLAEQHQGNSDLSPL